MVNITQERKYCLWNCFSIETQFNTANFLIANFDIEKHLVCDKWAFNCKNNIGEEKQRDNEKRGHEKTRHHGNKLSKMVSKVWILLVWTTGSKSFFDRRSEPGKFDHTRQHMDADVGLSTAIFGDKRLKRIICGPRREYGAKPRCTIRKDITKDILSKVIA
jgi:hypothetical protein